MSKFQVMTPGGYEVEVSAATEAEAIEKAKANWQTMPRIIAKEQTRGGMTRVFERPNGQRYVVSPGYSTTNPEDVARVLDRMGGGQAAQTASRTGIDEDIIAQNPVAARASQFVRGVPFIGSYADEAIGAVAGSDAAAGTRALQGAMERQRPGETLGLNLAGGLTGGAAAGLAAPAAIGSAASAAVGTGSRGAQIARGALAGGLLGAGEGAVYGAGEGTTASERARSAGTGAGMGGAMGGLIGGAAPVVREGAQNVISLFRRSDVATIAREFGISQNAAKVIKNAFEMGDDIDAAVVRLQQAGREGMVGDAGEAAQSLLDAAATSGPAGAAAVRRPLEARATRSAEQLDQSLTGLLGDPAAGPRTAVAEIQQASAPTRLAAYDAAFSQPIDYAAPQGRAIEEVIDRVDSGVLMQAIREANEEMRSLGMTNQQIMAIVGDDGAVTFREMPNVRQLNEIKRALDSAARQAKDPRTGVDTQQSLRYSRLAREMRDAIVEATGGADGPYAQALKVGGDTIQERNAFLLGESLLSPRTRLEDIGLELGDNPSEAQLAAARSGLRTRIEEVVGNVRRIASDPNIDARQMVATLREMGSDNARAKIRAIMGDDADALIAALDEASVAAETRAATAANSRTAIRQATQAGVEGITAPGMAGELARGEPINAARRIVQAVTGMTDEYTETQRQRIYQDVARALTEKQGPEAQAALGVLKRAIEGQRLTDEQTEQLAGLLAVTLYSAGTPTATRSATGSEQ